MSPIGFKWVGYTPYNMHTVHLRAITRADGTVHLIVPTGAEPGRPVELEVRVDVSKASTKTKEEWHAWVQKMAGSIDDPTFDRPEQPSLDDIAPL